MMEATELRIGNYVNTGDIVQSLPMVAGVLCAVLIANKFQSFGAIRKFNQLKPIPLTEQWLIDFGFKKQGNPNNFEYYNNEGMSLKFSEYVKEFIYFELFDSGSGYSDLEICDIDYVHELQNLYYSINKKELIK